MSYRSIVVVCWIAMCLSVALCVRPAAAEDAPANDEVTSDAEAEETRVAATHEAVPQGIWKDVYLRFNDKGKVQNRRQNLVTDFSVPRDEDLELIAYRVRNATVSIFTDEPLKVEGMHPDQWQDSGSRDQRREVQDLRVRVTTELPPRSAMALEEVVGDLDLLIGLAPVEEIEWGPFSEITGEQQEVPGMPDASIKIKLGEEKKRVWITLLEGKGWMSLVELQIHDEDGEVVESLDSSDGLRATRGRHGRGYKMKQAEQGKLVIRRWSEVSIHKARFEAKDVPLPAAFSDDTVELSRAAWGQALAAAFGRSP